MLPVNDRMMPVDERIRLALLSLAHEDTGRSALRVRGVDFEKLLIDAQREIVGLQQQLVACRTDVEDLAAEVGYRESESLISEDGES